MALFLSEGRRKEREPLAPKKKLKLELRNSDAETVF